MCFYLEYSTLENLAEVILESGINEPNFRYSGARKNFYFYNAIKIISDKIKW